MEKNYSEALVSPEGLIIIYILCTKLASIFKKPIAPRINILKGEIEECSINQLINILITTFKLDKPKKEQDLEKILINLLEQISCILNPKNCKKVFDSQQMILLGNFLNIVEQQLSINRKSVDELSQEVLMTIQPNIASYKEMVENQIDYSKEYYLALPIRLEKLFHITIAFKPDKVNQYQKHIGSLYQVELIGDIQTVQIDGEEYKFQLVYYCLIASQEIFKGHITIKCPPGKAKNLHPWCQDPENSHYFLHPVKKTLYSILLPFHKTGANHNCPAKLSFDLDDTLIHTDTSSFEPNDFSWLQDGELLLDTEKTQITILGNIINQLQIPFQITTSRRNINNENITLEEVLGKLFPLVKQISFGCKIKSRSNQDRAQKKAKDKLSRINDCLIHFDDDPVVCEVLSQNGIGAVRVDFSKSKPSTQFLIPNIKTSKVYEFGFQALSGIGKSTILDNLAKILNKEGIKTAVFATDKIPKGNKEGYSYIQTQIKHSQKTTGLQVALWDTTFSGGLPKDIPQINLIGLTGYNQNPALDFIVGLIGMLNRTNHPSVKSPSNLLTLSKQMEYQKIEVSNYDDDRELIDILNQIGFNIEQIKEELLSLLIDCRIIHQKTYTLILCCYRDHAQDFRCKAMRQSRNPVFIWISGDDGDFGLWYFVANQFIRGAESLSLQTRNMSTENVENINSLKKFSGSQQEIMTTLLNEENQALSGYLSFKADGQLVGITWLKKCSIMGIAIQQVIFDSENPLANFVLNYAKENNWEYIPIIRSNGTFMISDKMIKSLLTGLKDHYLQKKIITNQIINNDQPDLIQLMSILIPLILNDSYQFINNIIKSTETMENLYCLSFEVICPNRTDLWGNVLTELACSYSSGSFRFLGYSYGDGTSYPQFVCHGACQEAIKLAGLDQPLFKKITINQEINQALELLVQVTNGSISEEQFISQWKPDDLDSVLQIIIDAEGFVLLTDDGEYSKIKTRSYYICHKLKLDNMVELMETPLEAGKYFPLVKSLQYSLGPEKRLLGQIKEIAVEVASLFRQMYSRLQEPFDPTPNLSDPMMVFWNSLEIKAQNSLVKLVLEQKSYSQFMVRFSQMNQIWIQFLESYLSKFEEVKILDKEMAIIALKRLFTSYMKNTQTGNLDLVSDETVRTSCDHKYDLELSLESIKLKKQFEYINKIDRKKWTSDQKTFMNQNLEIMNSSCFWDFWVSLVGGYK